MKKIVLGMTLVLGIGAIVYAQKDSDAPAAAKTAFTKAYPAATKVKWEKEDGNYEVSFVVNGHAVSAVYDAKGTLQESEEEIKPTDLPVAIIAYMKAHYKTARIKDAAKITKANGAVVYEAAIKGKDILFDANGKFMQESKD